MLTVYSLPIYIMYKYVKNKLDHSYCAALPKGKELSEEEIPLEELEIREMIEAWYQSGYAPLFGEDSEFWSSFSLEAESSIRGNWGLNTDEEKRSRLERLELTILTVLRNRNYFAAFKRVLSSLKQSPTQLRLHQLVSKASNTTIKSH